MIIILELCRTFERRKKKEGEKRRTMEVDVSEILSFDIVKKFVFVVLFVEKTKRKLNHYFDVVVVVFFFFAFLYI